MLKNVVNDVCRQLTEHQMLHEAGGRGSRHAGAFNDTRAILVRWDDARCAAFWDESEAGYEQADNGPTHLIIGRLATDEMLERLSIRYRQYSFSELKLFRDAAD